MRFRELEALVKRDRKACKKAGAPLWLMLYFDSMINEANFRYSNVVKDGRILNNEVWDSAKDELISTFSVTRSFLMSKTGTASSHTQNTRGRGKR